MNYHDKSRADLIRQIERLNARLAVSRRRHGEAAERPACHVDELTGLYDRSTFLVLALQQIRIARRTGRPLLLLYCRMEGMEELSGALGRRRAGRVLAEAGQILAHTFRESDIAGRLGPDAFGVLAVEAAEKKGMILENRLRRRVSAARAAGALPRGFSVQVAMARWHHRNPCSAQQLLARARAHLRHRTRQPVQTAAAREGL
jgi:diguanylate cyclase (GGDEF)-like protein